MRTFDDVVRYAVEQARFSDCAKSRRGVVVFYRDAEHDDYVVVGADCNGQPRTGCHRDDEPLACPGTELCRATCAVTAVHAEVRALRQAVEYVAEMHSQRSLEMLHVKIDDSGELVAGGPPSCVQCSKEILDSGVVDMMWLYEKVIDQTLGVWFNYTPARFHMLSLKNALKDKSPHG